MLGSRASPIGAPPPAPLQTVEALQLERVSFDTAPGLRPSGKPPVRIFLGSEEAQQRAERVFLHAVHKFRDPHRAYHVYLMKELPGFDRRTWRTGFTQYRFAIPELAGGLGRAIYNDVDQIYLTDPAELFDRDLDGHGYLAVAPADTSVMVMDCARMLPWWHLDAARHRGKRELVQVPSAQPGLWGRLPAGWNARDLEYRAGESRLLHYTTLHLQPWRPTPEAYSYHAHPLGELWLRLEREADAEGYQPFNRQRPSGAYRRLLAERRVATAAPAILTVEAREFLAELGLARPLLCTLDGPPAQSLASHFNPARSEQWPRQPAQALVVAGLLEWLPIEDVPWLLDALFALARRAVHLRIDLRQAAAPADRPAPPRLRRPGTWWREQLAPVAERHPGVAWQLDLIEPGGVQRRYRYTPAGDPPRVWVLLGRHTGDNRQLLALAEALDWPFEIRQLVFKGRPIVPTWLQGASLLRLDRRRSDPLTAPWPDLVLACGRRSAPVARWIRRQSGGISRLVQLGRPRAPLAAFDLVVTTPQYRLPARPNVLHNALPLNRPLRAPTSQVSDVWQQRVAPLPRPWIALLVGGHSGPYRLNRAAAAGLRQEAEAWAIRRGGSLLVTTSPRTPPAAADILLGESPVPGLRYRWRPNDPDNPYPAFIDLADEFIVTGDSASMLADACTTGRPVRFFPFARARLHPLTLLLRASARYRARRGARGTPRQQGAWDRGLDGLVAAGLLRPPRDLDRLHEALRGSGLAQPLDDPRRQTPSPAGSDLERTVAAVRRLLLRGRAVSR